VGDLVFDPGDRHVDVGGSGSGFSQLGDGEVYDFLEGFLTEASTMAFS